MVAAPVRKLLLPIKQGPKFTSPRAANTRGALKGTSHPDLPAKRIYLFWPKWNGKTNLTKAPQGAGPPPGYYLSMLQVWPVVETRKAPPLLPPDPGLCSARARSIRSPCGLSRTFPQFPPSRPPHLFGSIFFFAGPICAELGRYSQVSLLPA